MVLVSYADAIRSNTGSLKGSPRKSIPTGSRAGIGPVRRVLSRGTLSRGVLTRTRSYTCVVKPAGTVIAGKPRLFTKLHTPGGRSFVRGSSGFVRMDADTLPDG